MLHMSTISYHKSYQARGTLYGDFVDIDLLSRFLLKYAVFLFLPVICFT